jgi:hypothetical protein
VPIIKLKHVVIFEGLKLFSGFLFSSLIELFKKQAGRRKEGIIFKEKENAYSH